MTPQEITLWGKSLLVKIHVITGWVIPENELLTVLIDQFQKKMVESYPNTNPDEIEYAFRNYGTTVKDWGKAMNLALIDEVMIAYLNERKRLSHELEERNAPAPEQRIYTDEELFNLHRWDVENAYQRMRKGKVEPIPDYFRAILERDGLIKNGDEAEQFFVKMLNSGAENIYIKEA